MLMDKFPVQVIIYRILYIPIFLVLFTPISINFGHIVEIMDQSLI